ncbi:hypothetical protein Ocin01_07605 [Orchesella cincta]|uniref:Uncharacterized protein n=1 Tax=Orchesella cincta TaxID=48709 RepID=A0A1D2N1A2_ORCCI|nr:hypothetical protein Ocin01_07605 [Orchesella cincta]
MSYLLQQALQIHSKEKEVLMVENRICKSQYAWLQSVVTIQRIIRHIYVGEIKWMEQRQKAREPLIAKFNGDAEALCSWMKQGNKIGEKQVGARAKRSDLLARLNKASESLDKVEAKRNGEESLPNFEELSNMSAEERMELVIHWLKGEQLIRSWKAIFENFKTEWDQLNNEQEEEIEFYTQRVAELCQRLDNHTQSTTEKAESLCL